MEITEQIVDDKVMKYTYILGHGFSAADHKAVMLGRFGTTEEAKHHIENINQESQEDGGCIGFKDEFPFLILEILTIEFEKGKENED